ncbi:MAG TPA: zf-TFIIB domain-containing protein [Polyangia bacterium]
MEAGMLECPNCGAPAAKDALSCPYCNAALETAQCPSCLGMIFAGAKHCSHCGAAVFAKSAATEGAGPHACPRCKPERSALTVTAIGEAFLEECARCGGVWVDAESFKKICSERERQAAFIGSGSPLGAPSHAVPEAQVRYLACPDCGQVMNRMNFARRSGVIVDVCKQHGTWFDRDELREIVEFIRAGGLDAAREQELATITEERRRLESEKRASGTGAALPLETHEYGDAISAAGDLLKFFF